MSNNTPYVDKVQTEKSPIIAGLLSIIPGAGHIYVGKVLLGVSYLLMTLVMIGLIFWTNSTHEFNPFNGTIPILVILLVVFWLWVIGSAITLASRRAYAKSVGLITILAFVYFLGWQATEINLEKFFTEFPDTFRILTRVMWPWDSAFERDLTIDVAQAPFGHPCEAGNIPEQPAPSATDPWVTVDPSCGDFATYVLAEQRTLPGTPITVTGGGWLPNTEVEIWWRDPIGQEFRPIDQGVIPVAITDDDGNFEITFGAPQYLTPTEAQGVNVHRIQGRQVTAVGDAQISEGFNLALGRMIVTIFQAMMATTFGIVFALPFSFLAARNLMWQNLFTKIVYYVVRFVLNVTRSIEPIIWAVIAAVWVGLGPFAGVIALALHTIASLGKLYSEAIESIDPGPIEAVTATGANRLQAIMYAIIPQVIPPFLSFTIYRWDINVRMSTIIGFVGGGGIGQVLFQWINQGRWHEAGMAVWLIAITVSIMDYASSELRKHYV